MIGIISNPVTSTKSHNGGWTWALQHLLGCQHIEKDPKKFKDYDTLIINEGVNYKEGVYNFFGGVQQSTIKKILALSEFKGQLFIINEKLDFKHLFKKRKELNHLIDISIKEPIVLKTDNYYKNKLIIGDSHSISVYKPGYSISRNDGKTLFGFLRDVNIKEYKNYKDLITYFGNIDIRFHLARQKNPIKATRELALRYVDFCYATKAKPVCLLPIEDEGRKIPKTGKYKGRNFFGSRELRKNLVSLFNDILQSHFLDCYIWPSEWYDEGYVFENKMELRQSVHLRPTSYINYKITQQSLF